MEYVSQEYETRLQELAAVLVNPERFVKVSEATGQLALFEVQE